MRVQWSEVREEEPCWLVADLTPDGGWEFGIKTGWEVRWHPLVCTQKLIERAIHELTVRYGQVSEERFR